MAVLRQIVGETLRAVLESLASPGLGIASRLARAEPGVPFATELNPAADLSSTA